MMQFYECTSCPTLLGVEEGGKPPMACPLCRSRMASIPPPAELVEMKPHYCSECGYTFSLPARVSPYKCPACNWTFLLTPHKRAEERL